jgi:tetratricopeptide (TPR) repeat protein
MSSDTSGLRHCFGRVPRASALLLATLPFLASGADADDQPRRRTETAPFAQGVQVPQPADGALYEDAAPPLFDNLGRLSWAITTSEPQAQAFFDQGLRLAYGFNHAEARRAFRQAQKLDPACAMCFWGEAFVLGPNINAPMGPAASAPALAALQQAQARAGKAGDKEQALIAALAERYSADPKAERAVLDKAWAAALGKVAQRFPDDNDIAVFHAEALMDTQPWDYWADGGKTAKGRAADIVGALERVLTRAPDHPGGIHLYIHAVEASDRPERAEPHADRLAALMPGAGHIVHMPAHIYFRVGRYLDALEANKRAVAIDEAYIAAERPVGTYPIGYYPHNVHFLMAAAQMAGDGATVLQAAARLGEIVSPETAAAFPPAQPVMAAPYFAHAQFAAPEAVLALPSPQQAPPYVRAMWRYARGVALAKLGRLDEAAGEIKGIDGIERQGGLASLTSAGIPATGVLNLAREVIAARIAQARGDQAAAIAAFERAALVQDGLSYMEPPYWYYPVRQSLGAALLAAGRIDDAEAAFRDTLRRTPNNGWAIYGLVEVAKVRGDVPRQQQEEARLARAWIGDRRLLDLKRL